MVMTTASAADLDCDNSADRKVMISVSESLTL